MIYAISFPFICVCMIFGGPIVFSIAIYQQNKKRNYNIKFGSEKFYYNLFAITILTGIAWVLLFYILKLI